jgi:cytochrome c553
MSKRLVSIIFGVAMMVAAAFVAAAPANAADDIEQKAQVCGACHGQNGGPVDPKTVPIIWGQQANYLYKELHDYHSGTRDNPIMSPIAKTISLQELRKLADYFAAKSWPTKDAAPAPASPAAGIAEKVATCRACHGQNFAGGAPAPRLAGLSYEYLATAMQNFADDQRTNNGDMPGFMKALTADERDAMARYLSGL